MWCIQALAKKVSSRPPLGLGGLLILVLAGCIPLGELAPEKDPPLAGNQVSFSGGSCAIPDTSLRVISGSGSAKDLIDGHCEQPWTNLLFRKKNENPAPAKCEVSFHTGFTYRYTYHAPRTDISYYTSSQTYEVPRTKIIYFTESQTYEIPRTDISYYVSSQTYEIPRTSISYYSAHTEYDLPRTRISYYTQQGRFSLEAMGDYRLTSCTSFAQGKLPAGALSDAAHPLACEPAASVHKVGACSPSDPSVQNCKTYFTRKTLSPTPGDYQQAGGCLSFAQGKIPGDAVLGNAQYPVSCAAASPLSKAGACSVSDPGIQNCKTIYTKASLTKQTGDYQAVGCVKFAEGKISSAAVKGDAKYPIVCSASASGSLKRTGNCSPSDPAIRNCKVVYTPKSVTVDGTATQGCADFAKGRIPATASQESNHLPTCTAAGTRLVQGGCDASKLNCKTNFKAHTLKNQSGDFSAPGCMAFAQGKLPKEAILGDAAHPVSCTAAKPSVKSVEGNETYALASWNKGNFTAALNGPCSPDLIAHIASSKGLPQPVSCIVKHINTGKHTYEGKTCGEASPAAYCTESGGARKLCSGKDIPAEPPYAEEITKRKVRGKVSCDTPCAATDFCQDLPGTVGENHQDCSTENAENTIDRTFTAADAASASTCEAGQVKVVKKGPYRLHAGDRLLGNLPANSCVKATVCLNDTAWKNLTPVKTVPAMDIVILFDVTSSMTPYIQAMILNLQNLISNLNKLTPNLRIGLASYRDFEDRGGQSGDLPYMLNVPLTGDMSKVSAGLGALRAKGGGDYPESLATAIRAVVEGKAMDPYFSASEIGWENDDSRVKIILGISDASNKKAELPAGAPGLEAVAELLKSKGILFLGVGHKHQVEPFPGANDYASFTDLAFLAQNTGATVTSPGIDLDGDGKSETYGEIPPGEPAILLMTSDGQVEGASRNADPTRVLADAITKMVETTRPFQFHLGVESGGRVYTPEENSLSVSSESKGQRCFSLVSFDPLDKNAACGVSSPLSFAVREASNNVDTKSTDFLASLAVDLDCAAARPDPIPDPVPDPTPDPIPDPVPVSWTVEGFDGTTTSTDATLIWRSSGVDTTATVRVGLRADQLDHRTIHGDVAKQVHLIQVPGLAPGTTYYFRVDTRDSFGTVVQSAVIMKKTKL